jgi:hypothetical protein
MPNARASDKGHCGRCHRRPKATLRRLQSRRRDHASEGIAGRGRIDDTIHRPQRHMSSMPSRPPRSATCARGQRGAHTSECGRPVGACRSVASLARLCRATPVGRLSDSGREDSPILPVTRWRASARRAHGGPRWRPRTRHLCCFDFEEAFFRLEAPSKACERTVFADHAMARRHNGDRILSVCRANRSEGARLAD